jgi:hypothetical protein
MIPHQYQIILPLGTKGAQGVRLGILVSHLVVLMHPLVGIVIRDGKLII